MTKHNRFPPEVRQRAIRMVLENQNTYNSQWAAICSIAPKIGCTPETLRIWIRQQEPVDDEQNALTASERQRLKELEREVRELRRSNDILRQASAYFAQAELDRHWKKLMPLLENLSGEHGVGPVCHELDIAPSTYYWHQQRRKCPERRSSRDKRDAVLIPEIQRVYEENYSVYGVRKVWRQLKREGVGVASCTIERLMKALQLRGVTRGKSVRTTRSNKAETPQDRVNRQFVAERPDSLWVADFTYVSTWQGFAYVAFIIDVFAGVIVGWRVSSTMETSFVLDALEQALWARRPSGTIHHSDKGSQYVSLAYTQRLQDAELLASTGSTGDSYDNAMAESINGLYKAEVIHRQSWKTRQDVELATLKWVDWYNNHRLMERTGYIPPVEAEKAYYASLNDRDVAA
ncbi:TPA: IS3 family transposase, partial [Escherichia coli]|nr:IS3 family transposase [Escherichia coli]HAO1446343.1 IS3 family transposase [Escherichia coli]